MLLPSKVTPYNKSIFPQALLVVKILQKNDMAVFDLFAKCEKTIPDISALFTVLDFLYAVGKVELKSNGELHYVA